ncbi:GL24875 [Drosophila persimilis]|uniref:GL24875 n=1 Tax=Drosophila persimilis TaxID=7234 RepID=B4GRT6_DROPE|nr:GL24875 [Drosophila persimilis]
MEAAKTQPVAQRGKVSTRLEKEVLKETLIDFTLQTDSRPLTPDPRPQTQTCSEAATFQVSIILLLVPVLQFKT